MHRGTVRAHAHKPRTRSRAARARASASASHRSRMRPRACPARIRSVQGAGVGISLCLVLPPSPRIHLCVCARVREARDAAVLRTFESATYSFSPLADAAHPSSCVHTCADASAHAKARLEAPVSPWPASRQPLDARRFATRGGRVNLDDKTSPLASAANRALELSPSYSAANRALELSPSASVANRALEPAPSEAGANRALEPAPSSSVAAAAPMLKQTSIASTARRQSHVRRPDPTIGCADALKATDRPGSL